LFILFCSITFFRLQAQDWVNLMQDSHANVHDVQKSFYRWQEEQNSILRTSKNSRTSDTESEGEGDALFKRWEWFAEPRTYPTGNWPDPIQIYTEYQQYLSEKFNPKIQSIANWNYFGTTSIPDSNGTNNFAGHSGAGRVNRIVFYPGNNNIIFACTGGGGLWKTTDGGITWSTNTDQLTDIATGDLAIDPGDPSTMYLASGDGEYSNNEPYGGSPLGVLKSTDGGATWQTSALLGSTVNRILIRPDSTNIVYAATTGSVYYSTDYGKTFKSTIHPINVKDIEFEPFHPSTIYASSSTGQFYVSRNGGRIYTQITSGLPATGVGRISIGVSPADSNCVYVYASATNSTFYGLYRSTDRGQTFTTQASKAGGAPNLLGYAQDGSDNGGQGWYTLPIVVSPYNINNVMVGGVNIWASSDGGVTWSCKTDWEGTAGPCVHADIHQLCYVPGGNASSFFSTNDGGICKTTNNGASWTDLSNNLKIGQIYSIGLSASNPNFYLSGWQDNCSIVDNDNSCSVVLGGDGADCFIDYSNDSILYVEAENGLLTRSINGNAAFINTGITETGPFVTPWLQDPKNSTTLFAGFKNVWISTDQGNNWKNISKFATTSFISSLVVAPSDDQYVFVARKDTIYSTSDQGAHWNNVKGNMPDTAAITAIAVDPNNPARLWVTYSGFFKNVKVYHTDNGGSSWTNISSGLPNFPVNCIVYQKRSADGIYVGTDMGIYYRDSIGKVWIPYNAGLPNAIVTDLKIFEPSQKLRAATYGRGVWESPLNSIATSVTTISSDDIIKVYPNPVSNTIFIEPGKSPIEQEFSLYDLTGKLLIAKKTNGNSINQIDVSSIDVGVYFLKISDTGNTETQTRKIVVVK